MTKKQLLNANFIADIGAIIFMFVAVYWHGEQSTVFCGCLIAWAFGVAGGSYNEKLKVLIEKENS